MSKCILEAFGSYLNQNPNTTLHLIDIVIYDDKMVQDFESAMKSTLRDKGKSIFSTMSGWVSGAVNIVRYALTGEIGNSR